MVDITKRSVKGSPLTNDEVDDNFDNLNTGKVGVEDIGTDPNQVPLNQYLGSMAYQDLDAVSITGGTVVVDGLTVDTDTLYVDATNNLVGIGTSSPAASLDVAGQVAVEGTGEYGIFHAGSGGPLVGFESGSNLRFGSVTSKTASGFSEAMRIDSNGNLGIGTSSPTAKLTINGNQSFPERTDAYIGVDLATSSGDGGDFTVKAGGGYGTGRTSGNLFLAAGRGSASAATGYIAFGRSQPANATGLDTEFMRIENSGNVGIGTTSPSQALDVVGNIEVSGGVYLGGTGAANLLDDYEEGTFTPGLSFGGGSTGIIYGTQSGVYTKIGRMVYCQAYISLTDNGSDTGAALITGLPFTVGDVVASTGLESGGLITFFTSAGANVSGFTMNGLDNTTTARIYVLPTSGTDTSAATDTDITDTFNCRLFFIYAV